MTPEIETTMYDLRNAIEGADIEEALEEWWKLLDLLDK